MPDPISECPPASGGAGGTTASGSTSAGGDGLGGGAANGGSGGLPLTGTELDDRVLDYGEALRTASLKLVGDLPDLDQIVALEDASDPKASYEDAVEAMLDDPRFRRQMVAFWRNVFRVTELDPNVTAPDGPIRDSAAIFAARLVAAKLPLLPLFSADTELSCSTWDPVTLSFGDAACSNATTTVGVLTNPGLLAAHNGNLAFRRTRLFHEVFTCRSALTGVAEPTDDPADASACIDTADYESPWEPATISGSCTDTVDAHLDFHGIDADGSVCANCHATFNHRAPLWASFDAAGVESAGIAVSAPIPGYPLAVRDNWLPDGEPTAWRFGDETTDLSELGGLLGDDPEVHACLVKRVWAWGLSHGDPAFDGAVVPDTVVADLVADFTGRYGYRLGPVILDVLLSPDFVRF